MAGNDSFSYCDSDEECFIGKITEKELLKRALTGQNFYSPIPKPVEGSVKPVTIEEHSDLTDLNSLDPKSHDLSMDILSNSEFKKSPTGQGTNKDASSVLNDTTQSLSISGIRDSILDTSSKLEIAKSPTEGDKFISHKDSYLQSSLIDYVSINGISDSILNISHGSSITSPVSQVVNKVTSNLIDNAIYEDFSVDKEQIFGCKNRSDCIVQSSSLCVKNDDLHMSVDEIDYQQNQTIASSLELETILPQSTELNFYFDKSSVSSYHTANANNENVTSKQSSDSFKSYRKDVNDSADLDIIDLVTDIDIDDKDKKETSFEIIVQNRQNSFIPPSDGSKMAYKTEQLNTQNNSRLPVYSHSAKSLIQPPKLNFTSDYIKSNSYKWANKIQTVDLKKTKLNENIEVKRDLKCKLPTPLKLKSQFQEIKEKDTIKPVGMVQCSSNIPSLHKTPLKPVANQPSRLVKSELKTPRVNTPRPINMLSTEEEKNKHITPSLLKNRFKNIISPVQAYISGSPTVLQKRKDVVEEIKLVDTRISKKKSNLPMKIETELAATKIVEKGQTQENVDPNYSRDLLPPKSFENSDAVFMKEPEPPKAYLPKMGQKMQKLLDTPRPKIVVHQERVKHSPNMKGVLLPKAEHNFHLPTERVSIRVEKTANTNELK